MASCWSTAAPARTAGRSIVAAATGGRRVHTVFNTHWHLDQTGERSVRPAGASIVAHEKTRQCLAIALPADGRPLSGTAREGAADQSFYTTGSTVGGSRSNTATCSKRTQTATCTSISATPTCSPWAMRSRPSGTVLDWFDGGWVGGRVDSLKQLLDSHG